MLMSPTLAALSAKVCPTRAAAAAADFRRSIADERMRLFSTAAMGTTIYRKESGEWAELPDPAKEKGHG